MTKKTSKKTLFSPLKPRGYRTYLIRLTFSEIRTSWKTQKKEKYILICLFYLFLTHNGFFLKKKKETPQISTLCLVQKSLVAGNTCYHSIFRRTGLHFEAELSPVTLF